MNGDNPLPSALTPPVSQDDSVLAADVDNMLATADAITSAAYRVINDGIDSAIAGCGNILDSCQIRVAESLDANLNAAQSLLDPVYVWIKNNLDLVLSEAKQHASQLGIPVDTYQYGQPYAPQPADTTLPTSLTVVQPGKLNTPATIIPSQPPLTGVPSGPQTGIPAVVSDSGKLPQSPLVTSGEPALTGFIPATGMPLPPVAVGLPAGQPPNTFASPLPVGAGVPAGPGSPAGVPTALATPIDQQTAQSLISKSDCIPVVCIPKKFASQFPQATLLQPTGSSTDVTQQLTAIQSQIVQLQGAMLAVQQATRYPPIQPLIQTVGGQIVSSISGQQTQSLQGLQLPYSQVYPQTQGKYYDASSKQAGAANTSVFASSVGQGATGGLPGETGQQVTLSAANQAGIAVSQGANQQGQLTPFALSQQGQVSSSYCPPPQIFISCPPPIINTSLLPPETPGQTGGGSGGGSPASRAPGIFTVDYPSDPHAFLFSADDLDWKQRALEFEGQWLKAMNGSSTMDEYQAFADSLYPDPTRPIVRTV